MESSKSLTNRMIRAAKLDVQLYEEVEADSSANSQALMVVIIASLAVGIGGAFAGASVDGVGGFLWGLIIGLGLSIVGWLAWAFLAFWLGTTIFRGPQTSATFGELLRTIGLIRQFEVEDAIGGTITRLHGVVGLIFTGRYLFQGQISQGLNTVHG